MDILRFVTAGNVDDGKSSLIGRLLFDSGVIPDDVLEAIKNSSKGLINGELNLAFLTDGLKAEREQGITIDVSYKFFSTERRKFIIADSPGHVQYTRNMVTACSTADVAIILIDARHGITEQTRRHSYIISMMGVKHILFAINKMDLVDYSEAQFLKIREDILSLPFLKDIGDIHFIPVNSLKGCNIVHTSSTMPWYNACSLFSILENIELISDINQDIQRFSIQFVSRPQSKDFPDFRGYMGQVSSGEFSVGQEIKIYPSGFSSKIKSLYVDGVKVDYIDHISPATILIEDEINIERGYLFTGIKNTIYESNDLCARICWMDESEMKVGKTVIVQHNYRRIKAKIKSLISKKDMTNLGNIQTDKLSMNDIGIIEFKSFEPLFFDDYYQDKKTGSFIFIDPFSHATLAAGVFDSQINSHNE